MPSRQASDPIVLVAQRLAVLALLGGLSACSYVEREPPLDAFDGDMSDADDGDDGRIDDARLEDVPRDPGILDDAAEDAAGSDLPTPGNLEFCNDRDDDGDGKTDEGLWCWLSPGPLGLESIRGVWGSRSDDVWVVSSMGSLAHWDGRRWSSSCTGVPYDLFAVWGFSGDDIWAVGESGTSVHWDGAAWSRVPTGSTVELHGVWGSAPNDVWAVGGDVIEHWDGAAWTGRPIDPPDTLYAVWGLAADDVWTAGSGADLWHWAAPGRG